MSGLKIFKNIKILFENKGKSSRDDYSWMKNFDGIHIKKYERNLGHDVTIVSGLWSRRGVRE